MKCRSQYLFLSVPVLFLLTVHFKSFKTTANDFLARISVNDTVAVAATLRGGINSTVTQAPQEQKHQLQSQSQSQLHSQLSLRLQVPFYIYENQDLNWENATFGNGDSLTRSYDRYKHSDDIWLLRAAKKHPMRTYNPQEAKLFFVPVLLNAACFNRFRPDPKRALCLNRNYSRDNNNINSTMITTYTNTICLKNPQEGFDRVNNALATSKYFQKSQGKDHVVVMSHWARGIAWMPDWIKTQPQTGKAYLRYPNLDSCHAIQFEGWRPKRTTTGSNNNQQQQQAAIGLPCFYVGQLCPNNVNHTQENSAKKYDFAFIGSLKPEDKRFQPRDLVCNWLRQRPIQQQMKANTNTNSTTINNSTSDTSSSWTNYTISVCGQGRQCPALPDSKYGFHIRGDTYGSNRAMDILLARSVPIFTHPEQYNILPPFLPWKNMTYLVDNLSSPKAFHQQIQNILNRPESDYQHKLDLINYYMPLLDHKQIYQFDAYMAEIAVRMGFQKRGPVMII